ncbi:MAG: hypothetical protein AABO58_16615 [Acidobacteriota bacterium]
MRTLLFLLLIAAPAVAQRPETDSKGGAYADRLKDDIRARKMYEKTARAAISARFRQALEKHQPGEGDLAATWGEFVTAAGTPFAALQLAVPAGVSAETLTLFGVAGDASYFEEVAVQQSHGDAFVERSVLLPPGKTRGMFGLARKNEILGLARVELEPPSDVSRLISSPRRRTRSIPSPSAARKSFLSRVRRSAAAMKSGSSWRCAATPRRASPRSWTSKAARRKSAARRRRPRPLR